MRRALPSVGLLGRIVVAAVAFGTLASSADAADRAPLTLPRDQRPEWVRRDGIVMAGSWEPLAFRVRRDGKSYTPNAKQLADWQREHSPEMVQRLKSIGVNFVMMHCYKGGGLNFERGTMADAVRFSQLCHEAGLKVGVYNYSGAFMWEWFFRERPEAEDWVVRGPDGKPISYGSAAYRYYWNRNHPQAEAFYRTLVDFSVNQIKTDLVHFDNYNIGPGHDRVSVQRFREYLRKTFSPEQLNDMGVRDVVAANPPGAGASAMLNRAWQDFCTRSLAESYWRMSRYTRSLRSDVLVECNPNGVAAGIYPPIDHGKLLAGGEAYWVESGRIGYRDGRLTSRIRHYKVGRAMDNMTFDYTLTPLEMAESMAFNLDCLGCICWFEYGEFWAEPAATVKMSPALDPFVRFFHRRRDLLAGTGVVADLAVLRSFPSMVYGEPKYAGLTAKVEDLLIDRRVPFQILHEHQLGDLRRFRAVVLPACAALADDHVAQLRRYAAGGGTILAIGPVATHDRWMQPRKTAALDDLPATSLRRATPNGDLLAAIREACGGFSLRVEGPTGRVPAELPGLCAELTQKEARRLVHLVNYRADGPLRDVVVTLRLPPGRHAQRVVLASPERPDERVVGFAQEESGGVQFRVPEIGVYEIAAVEFSQ